MNIGADQQKWVSGAHCQKKIIFMCVIIFICVYLCASMVKNINYKFYMPTLRCVESTQYLN